MTPPSSSGEEGHAIHESARAQLGQLRLDAILALSRGDGAAGIARSLGVSIRTVQRWARRLKELGPAAMREPVWPGKSARLGPELLTQLKQDIQREPQALGYPRTRWTASLLSGHIRRCFGLRIGDRQCLRILHQLVAPHGGNPSKSTTMSPNKALVLGHVEVSPGEYSHRLSDRQLKERALRRIRRLASSGLPLVPFASTLFDLTSDAVPQAEGIRGICPDVHERSWYFSGLDYLKWEPAIRKYAMEDDPAESGIVPQVGRDPAITTTLSFEQMVFPEFHKLPGYHELYRHLNAHHFIGAMLGQGDALGIYALWRSQSMKPFSSEDLHFLHFAAPHITHSIKTARLLSPHSSSRNDFHSLANSQLGVVLTSSKGKVLALNQEAERLFHQLGVFNQLKDDGSQVSQTLDYIAHSLRTIFTGSGESNIGAPAARLHSHWSGITLSMRGLVTDGSIGQGNFVVLIEQGERGSHRRQRIMYRYGLSPREAELLELFGSGLPMAAIAERMRIAKGTIKTYSSRLAEKLGLSTVRALRAFSIERTV
ncbi:MAG: helix-turn-helix domain-containing protein [Deltaproteobacteria bacterium]|nr:helix-turn-helix domain-containing protein [Deltaproteobacteria bacterium]